MPDPLTHDDAKRLLDVLQGISRGLVDINTTLRRIAAALEGRSGAPGLGPEVWPERETGRGEERRSSHGRSSPPPARAARRVVCRRHHAG
jgi:hypothetical protein